MSKEDTPIKFHDFVTELLIDLAGEDDEEPGDDLKESMAELTDILFESLSFKVTGDSRPFSYVCRTNSWRQNVQAEENHLSGQQQPRYLVDVSVYG